MRRFTKVEIIQKLKDFPIVPVFYDADLHYTQNILQTCYEAGLRVFEYTNRGKNAKEVFESLQLYAQTHCPEMVLGIGTIFTQEDALYYIEKGSEFVVQPVCTSEVASICQKHNLLWIPGVMTLNEIYQASLLGAEIVKIFPANMVGANYIKAILAPMPHLNIMVTGGVEPAEQDLEDWFSAGVMSVGIGSKLFQAISENQTSSDWLKNHIGNLLNFAKKLTSHK